jgi:hypothetical protein
MQAQDSELTATEFGPPRFLPVPGHPALESDTPALAALFLEEPWASVAVAVGISPANIRLASPPPGPIESAPALQPDAVHDPIRRRVPVLLAIAERGVCREVGAQ